MSLLCFYSTYQQFVFFCGLVIQYGFITIFVAAFPLGPFFALINNLIEIRVDAYKYVAVFRRHYSERVEDIGIWFEILSSIAKISVVVNVSHFSKNISHPDPDSFNLTLMAVATF